jgi:hypothetical protein
VNIRDPLMSRQAKYKSYRLMNADDALARLYRSATTKKGYVVDNAANKWAVEAGGAALFLHTEHYEMIAPPPQAKAVPIPEEYGFQLYYSLTRYKGRVLPTWTMQTEAYSDTDAARRLRIYLLHLHAEQECFRLVTGNKIGPRRGTPESEDLQQYLEQARRYITDKQARLTTQYNFDDTIEQVAREALREVTPSAENGITQAAIAAVEELDMRLRIIDACAAIRAGIPTLLLKRSTISSSRK